MSEKSVVELDAAWYRYFAAGDLDALVNLYEPDGVLVAASGGLYRGTDAIRTRMQTWIDAGMRAGGSVKGVLECGDVAVPTMSWWYYISPDTGEAERALSGEGYAVARRQPNGDWRYVLVNLTGTHPSGD